jgi:hypothetical protein
MSFLKTQLLLAIPRRHNRCAPSIDLGVFIRFLHGPRHGDHGREMKDDIHAFHRFSDKLAIENCADDEFAFQTRQIVPQTATQIIKDANLCSILKVFTDMPSDETGTSRN